MPTRISADVTTAGKNFIARLWCRRILLHTIIEAVVLNMIYLLLFCHDVDPISLCVYAKRSVQELFLFPAIIFLKCLALVAQ